jgi:hypothetical protein
MIAKIRGAGPAARQLLEELLEERLTPPAAIVPASRAFAKRTSTRVLGGQNGEHANSQDIPGRDAAAARAPQLK